MGLADLMPFRDNPQELFMWVAVAIALIGALEIMAPEVISRVLRQNTKDRLIVRPNLVFNNGGRIESIKGITFLGEQMVNTPSGPRRSMRAAFYNMNGEKIGAFNSRELDIPLEALTRGEPAQISPYIDKYSDFEKERATLWRQIETLRAEKNRAYSQGLEFAKTVSVAMGQVKKELGGTMIMRPNGRGGFDTMPGGGEGGTDG